MKKRIALLLCLLLALCAGCADRETGAPKTGVSETTASETTASESTAAESTGPAAQAAGKITYKDISSADITYEQIRSAEGGAADWNSQPDDNTEVYLFVDRTYLGLTLAQVQYTLRSDGLQITCYVPAGDGETLEAAYARVCGVLTEQFGTGAEAAAPETFVAQTDWTDGTANTLRCGYYDEQTYPDRAILIVFEFPAAG